MVQILVPRLILSVDPVSGELSRLADHAVAIDGDSLVAVGPSTQVISAHPGAEVVRRPDRILTPGFVNGHHHVGVTPFQHGIPDSPLETWIAARVGEDDVDLRLDTLYSAVQMLHSGITTVQHIQGWYPNDATDLEASATKTIDAYQEIGMRVSFSKMIRDQNLFVHGDDLGILPDIDEARRAEYRGYLSGLQVPLATQLELFASLRGKYAGDPRTAIQLAPANFHWTSDEALERISTTATEADVPLHMHLLETAYQLKYLQRRTKGVGVRYLERFGLLNDRLTLGHGTWLQPDDVAALAEYGVHVCHNCSSNFRLSSGKAPITDLVAAGVGVAIGIDEAGINDDRDMLQEMRLVYIANRGSGILSNRLSAAKVFEMATVGGAATTPFASQIGTIAAGRTADLVLVDEQQLNYPYQQAGVTPEDLLIQRGRDTAVTDVMVGGEWALKDSKVVNIDEDALMDELQKSLAAMPTDRLAERRALAATLKTAVSKFFTTTYGI